MTRALIRWITPPLLASAILATTGHAQSGELDRIQLGVLLSPATLSAVGGDGSALQRAFEVALADKGMGASLPGIYTRFVAYVDLVPLQEELIPGGMVAVRQRVSVTFGDGVAGRAIASFETDARAVGKSKETALRNLASSLRLKSNTDWNTSVEAANSGIINFFEKGCDALLREADVKVKQKDFDEAMYMVTSVPREAATCHKRAMQMAGDAYTAKQKSVCVGPYADARAKWAASKSRATASVVADIIGQIPAVSPCFGEASGLMNAVASVIASYDAQAATERREQMASAKKRYDDQLALTKQKMQSENELTKQRMQSDNALAAQAIEAARQVGVEQAKKKGPLINIQKWSR